jgi:hypothetical protein
LRDGTGMIVSPAGQYEWLLDCRNLDAEASL